MAPGGDQKIGLYTVCVGVLAIAVAWFFPTIVAIAISVVGGVLVLFGVAALIQSSKSKVRALSVLDKKARTITQGSTVLNVADVTGIGLIPIKSFVVVGVHRTEGKPLWLSSAAKMPRLGELEAAVEQMAKTLSVPYIPLPAPAQSN